MIRPARTDGDVAAVRALMAEYLAGLGFDPAGPSLADELAGLPGRYAPPDGALFLAEREGSPAGCAAIRPAGLPDTCELKRLYVRAGDRGAGMGEALLSACVAFGRTAGYRRLVLDTLADMSAAHALYRRAGLREIAPYQAPHAPGMLFFGLQLRPA